MFNNKVLVFVAGMFLLAMTSVSLAQPKLVQHVSITWEMAQMSGDPIKGSGTGFLLSREKGLVVTAYHVVPNIYSDITKQSLALKANGVLASLKCFWKEADVALLQLEGSLNGVEEMPINASPAIGMSYKSGMTSDRLMILDLPHDAAGRRVVIGGSLQSQGTVLQISEAKLLELNGAASPTGAEYLVTDTPSKQGFSGGPAISDGKVIGIQQSISTIGSYGALSSAKNIERMLSNPKCLSQ